ncbi:TetR/AcrR family transcriptional regulator [Pollutimonas harenae]|uniref:TetR/AcrR family transcriptional regulator n=1 Tax=Pollutimonas harenae TaxID=657015 RepID=A0A853GP95_9BURK|nr:TetR/AcrR family transcriptional regulator [Pollutimonas harenae]NYT84858.1 TetR/AcrR family transcriptional regulator [Pollutimonas harenae]TEA72744.1 TetR/AcrR family transcriptional regulator [Pollutimonas harenae]
MPRQTNTSKIKVASPTPPVSKKPKVTDWRKAQGRSERGRLIHEALFTAASEVVGERGYEDASISLITQRAGVAQGTFYNHFESRQDILDQLLPRLGKEMLDYVGECSRPGKTVLEREELGFRGFYTFLKLHPHFFRILNEAPSFAPKAHQTHIELVRDGYMRFLKRGLESGEIRGFDEQELEVAAFVMMGARLYLGHYATHPENSDNPDIPDWVTQAYRKLITHGLTGTR